MKICLVIAVLSAYASAATTLSPTSQPTNYEQVISFNGCADFMCDLTPYVEQWVSFVDQHHKKNWQINDGTLKGGSGTVRITYTAQGVGSTFSLLGLTVAKRSSLDALGTFRVTSSAGDDVDLSNTGSYSFTTFNNIVWADLTITTGEFYADITVVTEVVVSFQSTNSPTKNPTISPTTSSPSSPTSQPTNPTLAPTNPTNSPTNPTNSPTTVSPTRSPSVIPTPLPTSSPTVRPTTGEPTVPTATPTTSPTYHPNTVRCMNALNTFCALDDTCRALVPESNQGCEVAAGAGRRLLQNIPEMDYGVICSSNATCQSAIAGLGVCFEQPEHVNQHSDYIMSTHCLVKDNGQPLHVCGPLAVELLSLNSTDNADCPTAEAGTNCCVGSLLAEYNGLLGRNATKIIATKLEVCLDQLPLPCGSTPHPTAEPTREPTTTLVVSSAAALSPLLSSIFFSLLSY